MRLSCLLLLPCLLSADVTLRYKIEAKPNASLPPTLTQAFASMNAAGLASDRVIRQKGGKTVAASGTLNAITDLQTKTITLLDPAGKRFATVPLSQYMDEVAGSMPQVPDAVRAVMGSMKTDTSSKLTGRTEQIQGMEAAEREIVISVSSSALPNMPNQPLMRMVMQIWTPTADAVGRNPAIGEFVASGFLTLGATNPFDSMQKMFAQLPLGEGMVAAMKDLTSSGYPALRMRVQVFMPMIAAMARTMPAANNPFGAFDANTSLIDVNDELTEMSTAPIPDSAFLIPADYRAVPMSDIMSAAQANVAAALKAASTPPRAVAPAAPPPPLKPGEYAVGNGVTPPSVLSKRDPEYSLAARAAKLEGTVVLSIVVGSDGRARDIQVLRPLDPELDQKAIEAVQQWTFKPGTLNGRPVNVRSQIEVNFRLL